jgi:hypothetical protein
MHSSDERLATKTRFIQHINYNVVTQPYIVTEAGKSNELCHINIVVVENLIIFSMGDPRSYLDDWTVTE